MKSGNPSRLETQVVIIGASGAGMAAAVTAAEKGADVIVLEKLRDLGE
jgi:urocanate reductase